MPKDPLQRAKAISLMAWFSNTVHPNFTHIGRPERFATDTSVHEHLKATGRDNFHANLKEIDGLLAGKQWILGDDFSVVDGYALVFYGWGKRIGLPMAELKNYTAWKDRMLARPAVKRVLEREQSVLLAA
jgi:glutathione S-transferase